VKNSFRKALVDSHIPAVAIAVLLVWSLDSAAHVLSGLWLPVTDYFAWVIATLGFPLSPYSFSDRTSLVLTLFYVFEAVAAVAAAWLLSRWAFGLGPLRTLSGYRTKLQLRRGDD
jgi:hypothetical protein